MVCGKEAQIIATSANQIVLLKICGGIKILYYKPNPSFLFGRTSLGLRLLRGLLCVCVCVVLCVTDFRAVIAIIELWPRFIGCGYLSLSCQLTHITVTKVT